MNQLKGNLAADIADYDKVHVQILQWPTCSAAASPSSPCSSPETLGRQPAPGCRPSP
jgi:hypothetical protein